MSPDVSVPVVEYSDPGIDGLLVDLAARLRGPHRLRRDLMAEARDGLQDAVQAMVEHGRTRADAARIAVAEFGRPGEVARWYQPGLAGPRPASPHWSDWSCCPR